MLRTRTLSLIRRHPSLSLFCLALLLRLAWMAATVGNVPVSDAVSYLETGKTIAAAGDYLERGRPSAFWPVGYPFFLSCFYRFGDDILPWVRILQCLLSSLVPVMVYRLAKEAGAAQAHAGGAALALAVFPSSLSLASALLTETLFTTCLAGAYYLARRPGRAAPPWAGILLAAACYIRPVALILVPLVHLEDLLRKKWRRYAAGTLLLAAVVAATAAPWAARNHRHFGRVVLYATNFGFNLYVGHNPHAQGRYGHPPELLAIVDGPLDEGAQSQVLAALAWGYIKADPVREAALFLKKAASLLLQERETVYETLVPPPGIKHFTRPKQAVAAANNLFYLAILLAFLRVPWWKHLRRDPRMAACAAVFWAQILFYCLFFATDRYKYPALPFALVASALYWTRKGEAVRPAEGRPEAPAVS